MFSCHTIILETFSFEIYLEGQNEIFTDVLYYNNYWSLYAFMPSSFLYDENTS